MIFFYLLTSLSATVHISLFLFLLGLADFLWNTYIVVAKDTMFPISFCVTLYVFSTIAPVVNPKSPYRTFYPGLVFIQEAA